MSAPLGSDTRAIAGLGNELAKLQKQVELLQMGAAQSDLGFSSIEDGSLIIYDADGNPRNVIGKQEDGSYVGGVPVGFTSPPEVPKPPTVIPGFGTVRVMSHGSTDPPWPKDFSHVTVYLAKGVEGGDIPLEPGVPVGTIIGEQDSMLVVTGLEPGVPYRAWLTSSNISGSMSEASDDVVFTPLFVVGPDILDGAIDELKLAAEAVTAAKIAAGAVGDVQLGELVVNVQHLAEGAVEGPKIAPSAIAAGHIAAHAIQTNHIAAGAIDAGTIAAGAISTEKLAAAAVTAEKILALSITGDKIAANEITGGKIKFGTLTGDHIRAGAIFADVTLETGVTGRRVQISGPGNEIRFYPNIGETEYGRIYSYISAAYPADLTLEMRAIDSAVTNIIPRLFLTPDRIFLGITAASDDTQQAGGILDLQQQGAFFGYQSGGVNTTTGLEVDGGAGSLRLWGTWPNYVKPAPGEAIWVQAQRAQNVTNPPEELGGVLISWETTLLTPIIPMSTMGNDNPYDFNIYMYWCEDTNVTTTGFAIHVQSQKASSVSFGGIPAGGYCHYRTWGYRVKTELANTQA